VTPPRAPTLFTRLFRAQLASAAALLLVFGSAFYVDRNRTIARLTAERWAPALRAAAGNTTAAPAHAAPGPEAVRVASALPRGAVHANTWAPRISTLERTLRDEGVPVEDVAFSHGEPRPTTWIALAAADGTRRWLGIDDDLVESHVLGRTLMMLVLGLAVVGAASWIVARRVARPLEVLRGRMESHGGAAPAAGGVDARGVDTLPRTSEIEAIGAAWSALCARLAAQDSERTLLLAGVSHDLRSPLARVRMAAELLPDTPDVARRRASIVLNVEVADRLIESFLDYVRATELPLDAVVDLVELVQALLGARDEPSEALSLEAPARLEIGRANALLLERLIGNLVDNALRHGRPPARVRLRREGAHAVIDVEDRGDGIDAADQERVTQAFARGDGSRGTPGTGLGLAIVQQITRRMGGTLDFQRDGEVARVRVRLPVGDAGQ
jgi:two-component system osmolarity sensor histidine kinase EnvZ